MSAPIKIDQAALDACIKSGVDQHVETLIEEKRAGSRGACRHAKAQLRIQLSRALDARLDAIFPERVEIKPTAA